MLWFILAFTHICEEGLKAFTNWTCELQKQDEAAMYGVDKLKVQLKMVEETRDMMHYNLVYSSHHIQELEEEHDAEKCHWSEEVTRDLRTTVKKSEREKTKLNWRPQKSL